LTFNTRQDRSSLSVQDRVTTRIVHTLGQDLPGLTIDQNSSERGIRVSLGDLDGSPHIVLMVQWFYSHPYPIVVCFYKQPVLAHYS
jgi:hypothetical protein